MHKPFKYILLWAILWSLFQGTTLCAQSDAAGNSKRPAPVWTQEGKWVVMDSLQTVLYEVFPFDNGPDYPSEGLIRIIKNGQIGYADAETYVIVIALQFECAFPFENGKARVSTRCQTVKDGEHSIWKSDDWRYVDKKGKIVE